MYDCSLKDNIINEVLLFYTGNSWRYSENRAFETASLLLMAFLPVGNRDLSLAAVALSSLVSVCMMKLCSIIQLLMISFALSTECVLINLSL